MALGPAGLNTLHCQILCQHHIVAKVAKCRTIFFKKEQSNNVITTQATIALSTFFVFLYKKINQWWITSSLIALEKS